MKKTLLSVLLSSIILLYSCKKQNDIIPDPTVTPVVSTTPTTTVVNAPPPIGTDSLQLGGQVLANQATATAFTTRTWQGVPSIVADNNNVLYSIWYTGTAVEGPGNYVTLSISKDNGKTWLANALVVNPTATNGRCFDPNVWKDPYGNIYISWATSTNLWDGKGGVWFLPIKFDGTNLTYDKPRFLADGVMMNKPTLNYDKTSTIFPISVWAYAPIDYTRTGVYTFTATNNNVYSMYTDFKKMATIPFANNLRSFDEHSVVQLSDRSYMAIIRGNDGIYSAKSTDGITWGTPQKFTQFGMATTSSRAFFGRLKSGRLAIVLNYSAGTTRNNITIYLSSDEGATWTKGLLIDSRNNTSYPDLTQDSNGTIYVTYDYDRYGAGNIILAKMTETDIINGSTQNITTSIISKLR